MSTTINFNASVSNIVKFEKQTGKSLMSAFNAGEISMTTLCELIMCISDAEMPTIDAYIKENGAEKLTSEMEKALEEAGFLPKSKSVQQEVQA